MLVKISLKLILTFKKLFNVATRESEITYVSCIRSLLNIAEASRAMLWVPLSQNDAHRYL